MKSIVLFCVALVLGFTSGSAEEKRQDGVSQSGKIGWHIVEEKDDAQVLISEADQGESAAQKLCDVPSLANTKVFVSPNDRWIIIQSGGASLGVSLTVFQRENGMIYSEKTGLDIGAMILKKVLDGDAAALDRMDRVNTNFVAWSADSNSILVGVSTQGGKEKTESYFAVFDLSKQSVGFDLGAFNSKTTVR